MYVVWEEKTYNYKLLLLILNANEEQLCLLQQGIHNTKGKTTLPLV